MLARFDTDVVAGKPAYVIIWGFANDILRADPSVIDAKLAETRNNIQEMVARARTNGIVPILATVPTIRGPKEFKEVLNGFLLGTLLQIPSYQDYVNEKIEQVNVWIRGFAGEAHLNLLDLKPLLDDEDGYRKEMYAEPDGTHISEAGYQILTAYVQSILPALLW